MAYELRIWFAVSIISLALQSLVHGKPQVPCYFIFGDSLVDNGNNNALQTIAKVNYLPYGQLLGFDKFIQPFATARGSDILMGVNYGSGGAGIRDETGQQLTLYKYGARKVAIFGLGLIGCTPGEIGSHGTNGSACVDMINNDVKLFNDQFKCLVDDLNKDLPDAQFIFINVTQISSGDPSVIGITVTNAPCCTVSPTTGLCVANQVPCNNRSTFEFWDAFHPTEIANVLVGSRAYNAQTPLDAYPFDIRRLAQL
ncbi:hypothetical protein TEA_010906 [Camellia sinensis var. sinensis]|uniref:SGNH hydrolase-type esterase domain-containing protein n=1 Tax=Camellia sinensis var. sinensis TaxID=542762 RepID=A0A4S4E1L1_CAMSN|nr:hypothetical protein TEA_010906 [Camellia sinensis var. sinensis]